MKSLLSINKKLIAFIIYIYIILFINKLSSFKYNDGFYLICLFNKIVIIKALKFAFTQNN